MPSNLEDMPPRMRKFLKKPPRRISDAAVGKRKQRRDYTYPPHWRDEICAEQKWKCAYCGIPMMRDPPPERKKRLATLDHVVPRSAGGRTRRNNLVAACSWCNAAKGSKTAAEFRAFLASGTSGSAQDAQRLDPKGAGPAPQGETPNA